MELTATEIQGMMGENYTVGTELEVTCGVNAVCVDGQVWELRNEQDELIGTVNPTAALTADRVRKAVESMLSRPTDSASNARYSASPD